MTEVTLLLAALTFGGMTFFSFGFAPVLFAQLPMEKVRPLLRGTFPYYYLSVAGLSAVTASAAMFVDQTIAIVFTAIFLRIFVGKTLKPKQWISLLVLTLGVAVVMIHRDESDKKESSSTTSSKSLVLFGCILALVRGIGTALTNVLCEYVFKRQKEGFWYVNAELYLFGMIVNFISLLSVKDDTSSNIFHDMLTILPILIVLLGVGVGVGVGLLLT